MEVLVGRGWGGIFVERVGDGLREEMEVEVGRWRGFSGGVVNVIVRVVGFL